MAVNPEQTRHRHVVLYTEAEETGGVTSVLEELVRGAASRQFIIVCPPTPSMKAWAAAIASPNVQIDFRGLRNGARPSSWLNVAALLRLVPLFRTAGILHFHLHTPFACLPAIVLASVVTSAPMVATEHYITQLKFLRHRHLRAPMVWLREIRIVLQLAFMRRALRRLQRIVLVSEANRDFITASFPAECAGKTAVIPNGIDVSRYQLPPDAGIGTLHALAGHTAGHIVLVVAGLNNQKGHRFLLQALPEVLAQHPDTMVVLVGEGHLRVELEELAEELGIHRHLVFAGHRDDVPELLASCDLVVLPSLFEGMPMSVLEAMAAGKAVVATRVDGTAEAVVDGKTGLLVPPRDPAALAAAISSLLADERLRRRFGEQGRERARVEYDRVRMSARYASLFDTLSP